MKSYRVVGPSRVFGHSPDTEFERDIPADKERRLIDAGHIEPVPNSEPEEQTQTPWQS